MSWRKERRVGGNREVGRLERWVEDVLRALPIVIASGGASAPLDVASFKIMVFNLPVKNQVEGAPKRRNQGWPGGKPVQLNSNIMSVFWP